MRKLLSPAEYAEGILRGDRVLLGRAITLIESTLPEHNAIARDIVDLLIPHAGKSQRIGITGVPGVGKSSFIETFGCALLEQEPETKIAVLAVDPTSDITGGSILGDKTRMELLSMQERAFIRPSPSSNILGGVARRTHETIILCEAAGYNKILIETVGVGQSETVVKTMTDFFLLLLLPGSGDELQGIKRGIVEMADLIVVNKADGSQLEKAQQTRRDYAHALHLFPAKDNGWTPASTTCSALHKEGIENIMRIIEDYFNFISQNNWLRHNREQQAMVQFDYQIREMLWDAFNRNPQVEVKKKAFEHLLSKQEISPVSAAYSLVKTMMGEG